VFQFSDGTNNIYLYVPFTTSGSSDNAAVVDLTSTAAPSAYSALKNFQITNSSLTAFNILQRTELNQFYTSVVGKNTLLVSNFIFKVASTSTALPSQGTASISMAAIGTWDAQGAIVGNKLCYASTSNGNVIMY
jgi:hypothetical protein